MCGELQNERSYTAHPGLLKHTVTYIYILGVQHIEPNIENRIEPRDIEPNDPVPNHTIQYHSTSTFPWNPLKDP